MRSTLVLSLVVSLSLAATSFALTGPTARGRLTFALPFVAETGSGENPQQKWNGLCLADSLKAGLSVTLVSKKGICNARTARKFVYEYSYKKIKATRLSGGRNCSLPDEGDKSFGPFGIAVLGVEPREVHPVSMTADEPPVPKHLELKARKIAQSPKSDPCLPEPSSGVHEAIADSPPEVVRAGNALFLTFHCIETFTGNGPPVLVLNNRVFRLCGSCPRSPIFFSVRGKLYVTYCATVCCCGCGDICFFVYDLSGKKPELVYENWEFSD